jgi:anti-sigma regulatory factor (Ser/Thr protein kinase)
MARLVDDLLDVGRAVTGKIVLKRQPVNLAEAVKSSISAIASGNPNNHGRVDLVSEPVWVSGDPVRLEQIVGNLVSNALKFTRGEGLVSVAVGREGDDAVLRVADQGIGIPADMLPKIFDLFVQAHHTIDRTRGGLGIGLTLVRRLAELHGGTVHAASEGDGHGSTFTVRMPTGAAPKVADGGGAPRSEMAIARFRIAPVCSWTTTTIRARYVAPVARWSRCVRSTGWRGRWRCCSSARPIGHSTSRSSTSACPEAWTATNSHAASAACPWDEMCGWSRSPVMAFPKTASSPGRPASRGTS